MVSEPNNTTKFFTKNLLAIEMKKKKTATFMNKIVCFDLSMLELSKILTHEFCYDSVKPKHGEKAKSIHCIYKKQIIFIKPFHKMFKLDLILQIMK